MKFSELNRLHTLTAHNRSARCHPRLLLVFVLRSLKESHIVSLYFRDVAGREVCAGVSGAIA